MVGAEEEARNTIHGLQTQVIHLKRQAEEWRSLAEERRRQAEEWRSLAKDRLEEAEGARQIDVEHQTTLCLDRAREAVCGPRAESYGLPSDNHARTAALWTTYLQARLDPDEPEVTAADVCLLNILQKISRLAHNQDQDQIDSVDDIAGFAQNLAWVLACRGDEE